MRGMMNRGGAALAALLATSGATAQPSAMRAPLWRGVDRLVVDVTLSGTGVALADRLRGATLAAARSRSAWPVESAPAPEARGVAILMLHYDGTMLHATVRRALSLDDSEGARVTRPIALAVDADPATLDTAIANTVAAALLTPRVPGTRLNPIHREN